MSSKRGNSIHLKKARQDMAAIIFQTGKEIISHRGAERESKVINLLYVFARK